MWIRATSLYDFYTSRLGRVTQAAVGTCLYKAWPQESIKHQVIASYGYGVPYLEAYLDDADACLAFMPAQMGAFAWPYRKKNLVCLCDNNSIPLPSRSVDKLLITHGLEYAHHLDLLLREAWRVLVEGGELIIVTPNRRGLWARAVSTPLGCGTPYTGRQLFAVLESYDFTPIEKPTYCLFTPPMTRLIVSPSTLKHIESFGRKWCKKLGGLVFIRAEKRVIATLRSQKTQESQPLFAPAIFSNPRTPS